MSSGWVAIIILWLGEERRGELYLLGVPRRPLPSGSLILGLEGGEVEDHLEAGTIAPRWRDRGQRQSTKRGQGGRVGVRLVHARCQALFPAPYSE